MIFFKNSFFLWILQLKKSTVYGIMCYFVAKCASCLVAGCFGVLVFLDSTFLLGRGHAKGDCFDIAKKEKAVCSPQMFTVSSKRRIFCKAKSASMR